VNEDDDNGVDSGECPFVVHGLVSADIENKTAGELRAIALKHLLNGKMLGIGHAATPESIYDNPQLYPQIFPWLFPYGLGGIGNEHGFKKVSDKARKKSLLMYHDKRFQLEPMFPLVAINHEQIKGSATGGYLLAKKSNFPTISEHLLKLNRSVMSDLLERLSSGEIVKPVSDLEKECFQIINDLDHVAHHVQGSRTNRKYMHNEIWALTSFLGAPSWFITFSPADLNHPIALYYADQDLQIFPRVYSKDDRFRLIANNPVAGACFFKFIVELFISSVLGFGGNHIGLYGKTAGYYGTVEQQGRLTLHLHMLLWIANSLTPQEIHDKILDPLSDFQKQIVEYLESVCAGEFLTGTLEQVQDSISAKDDANPDRTLPNLVLPEPAPEQCIDGHVANKHCRKCEKSQTWWEKFKSTVDELLFRLNRHKCYSGCTDPKYGTCKARFPRSTFFETSFDPTTGALNMKKGEAWLNTFTPLLTYLMHCNTDVTSILSGTAIKSVFAYVTDYITKSSLKTHTMFEQSRLFLITMHSSSMVMQVSMRQHAS